MVNCLYRLRHDAVVCGNHQNDDVRHLRAARTHRRERRVTGRINKGDLLALCRNRVGTDALRDAARFPRGDRGGTNGVEQRRLTVVNVTHHRDNGCTGDKLGGIFFRHVFLQYVLGGLFRLVFEVDFHIRRHQSCVFVINGIVDPFHDAHFKQPLGDFHRRDAQLFREHLQRNVLGGDNGVVDFYRLDFLRLLFFRRTNLSVARLVFVEILHRHALLLLQGTLGKRFLFRIGLFRIGLFLLRGLLYVLMRRADCAARRRHSYALRTGWTHTCPLRIRLFPSGCIHFITLWTSRSFPCGTRTVRRRSRRFCAGFCHVFALHLTVAEITGSSGCGRFGRLCRGIGSFLFRFRLFYLFFFFRFFSGFFRLRSVRFGRRSCGRFRLRRFRRFLCLGLFYLFFLGFLCGLFFRFRFRWRKDLFLLCSLFRSRFRRSLCRCRRNCRSLCRFAFCLLRL